MRRAALRLSVLLAIGVCLIALWSSTAVALVSAGGGFYFQSPQPHGWSIGNLQFTSDAEVWATAATQESGQRLLHSTDAGTTWQTSDLAFDPDHDNYLDCLRFFGPAHARAIQWWSTGPDTAEMALVKSDDGGASWAMTPIETEQWYPYGACLPSTDDAVIYGRDYDAASKTRPRVMLTTRNGGGDWARTVLPFSSPFDLWTPDMTNYWAWLPEDGLGTKIYTSTDGGASWQAKALPEGSYFVESFRPVDSEHAWALVFHLGTPNTYQLLATDDGGESWDLVRTLGTRTQVGISVLSADRVYLSMNAGSGAYQGTRSLERTTDGGKTWSFVRHPGSVAIGGIVEGPSGTLLTPGMWRSSDGGSTWERLLPHRQSYMLEGVTATSDGTVFAVGTTTPGAPGIYTPTGGRGLIFRSRDGVDWKQVNIPGGGSLRAADFYGRYGWAGGSSGRVLRSTDGGATWRAARTVGKGFVVLDIEATGPRSAVAVVTLISNTGTHCGIARTTNAGASWKLSRWSTSVALRTLSPAGKGGLVAVGMRWGMPWKAIALASSDGGKSWRQILSRSYEWEVRDVAFTDALHGCVLLSTSADWTDYTKWGTAVLRTSDGGRTWAYIDLGLISTYSLTSLAFTDADTGWAVGDRILKTTDGGASWQDTHAAVPWAGTSYIPEASLFGVATSRGNVWAVGSGQLILSTVDTARDTAPPVTSDDGDRLWHASDVTTNLAAVDVGGEGVARTQYRVDGSPWKDWTGAGITVQAEADHSADGEHKLYYRSTDKAGNTEFPQLCVMRIDTRKPKTASYGDVTVRTGGSARITYKVSDKAPCGSMATVTITIRDAAGAVVDTVALGEQNIGAKLKASFACTLAAGSYTYRVTAVDAAGNPQAAAGTGTLVVRE